MSAVPATWQTTEVDPCISILAPALRPITQSEPEAVLLAAAWLNGIPLEPQYQIDQMHADMAWAERGIAIEVDGRQWHLNERAFRVDRKRDRVMRLYGWTVLRFTANEVFANPGACLAEIVCTPEALPFSEWPIEGSDD